MVYKRFHVVSTIRKILKIGPKNGAHNFDL